MLHLALLSLAMFCWWLLIISDAAQPAPGCADDGYDVLLVDVPGLLPLLYR
jgi:hypothetical protein